MNNTPHEDETWISPIGQSVQEHIEESLRNNPEFRAEYERTAPFRTIARTVMFRRGDLGLTQQEVAKRAATSHSAISRQADAHRVLAPFLSGSNHADRPAFVADRSLEFLGVPLHDRGFHRSLSRSALQHLVCGIAQTWIQQLELDEAAIARRIELAADWVIETDRAPVVRETELMTVLSQESDAVMLMHSLNNAGADGLDLATALLPDVAEIHAEASLGGGHQFTETVAGRKYRILARNRHRPGVAPLIATRR